MVHHPTAPDGAELARTLVGLDDYDVLDADDGPEGLVVRVLRRRAAGPCPGCGTFSTSVKSYRTSMVVDAAAQGRRCRLEVVKRAFRCTEEWCGRRSFTETTSEVPARARVTTRCRAAMGRAGRDRSTAGVAAEYGVSWPTAWRAISDAARRAVGRRPRRLPRRLGIDETRFWWRQPWLTGLVDLDTGELVDVICGRDSAAVTAWLAGFGAGDRAGICVVVTDPHAGYRRAVTDTLDDAVTVVDRFHVAMLAGRAVTEVRRRRIWETRQRRGRKVDPSWRARRDLLRRRARLTARGWDRVLGAFAADADADAGGDGLDGQLAAAWAAKERLAAIYDRHRGNRTGAHRALLSWYATIAEHPVPELVTLARTISAWENQFLAYFDTGATNGRTEGINRIVKHIKRNGFGYRNTHNYRLRLLYRCRPLPSAPPGTSRPAAA